MNLQKGMRKLTQEAAQEDRLTWKRTTLEYPRT